jgi:hypothetical protein
MKIPVRRGAARLLPLMVALALACGPFLRQARAAGDGIRIRVGDASLVGSGDFFVLTVRGDLGPADGSPVSSLSLPARDLVLTVGHTEDVISWVIPALDPGWKLNRGGRWTWRTEAGASRPTRFRYDPETGAFDLVVRRLSRLPPVERFSGSTMARFDMTVDGALQGSAWMVLYRSSRRVFGPRGTVGTVVPLEVGAAPVAAELGNWGSASLFRFEVVEAGRYRVPLSMGTLAYAGVSVFSAEGLWQYTYGWPRGGGFAVSWSSELEVDLLPGTFILAVDNRGGGSGTFAVSVVPTGVRRILPVGGPRGTGNFDLSNIEMYAFDVTDAGQYLVNAYWDPPDSYGYDRVRLQVFGPDGGGTLVGEAEDSGGATLLDLSLPAGRYLVCVSYGGTGAYLPYTVGVSR